MKYILISTFSVISLVHSFAQIDLTNFGSSTRVKSTYDPIKKVNWRMANFRVWSDEKLNFNHQRYGANIEILINDADETFNAEMRFILKTNIEEWPIGNKAYLIINDLYSEILLNEVHSATHLNANSSKNRMALDEDSTIDFQLVKKEADLSQILRPGQRFKNFSLIVYTGNLPVEFSLDTKALYTLRSMLE